MLYLQLRPVQSSAIPVLKFNPNQPRDDDGRWAGVGGQTTAAEMRAEPLPPTLAAAEHRIRHEMNEHVFQIRDGKPFKVLGNDDPHAVQLGNATDADLTGAVLTHNHPSGMGPSQQDAFTAAKRNVLEVRAVIATGTHSIRRTGATWPPNFYQAVRAMHEAVKADLEQRIVHSDISIAEANAMHHKLLYSRLQRQLGGFTYTFEPHDS
jgi:hypothetical protein